MNAYLVLHPVGPESMIIRSPRRAGPATLPSCGVVAFAALIAACEPAPECDETVAALASYPVADQNLVDASMTKLVPYSNRLTGSDTELLRATCRNDRWSASYRRCVRAARSTAEVQSCNAQHRDEINGAAWIALPHEKAWRHALADRAYEAMMGAADRARDKQQAVEQVERSITELDQTIALAHGPPGKIAELERVQGELRASLVTAQAGWRGVGCARMTRLRDDLGSCRASGRPSDPECYDSVQEPALA